MSRNRAPEAEDIWTRLQREKQQQLSQPSPHDGPTPPTTTIGPDGQPIPTAPSSSTIQDSQAINQNIIFLGDGNSGKSSLIQTFLKPNAASKDTKPTVALEYNFARKTNNNNKYLAHFWEIGGDFIEPALLEIPLTKAALTCTTIIIVCDMSKPHNVVNSLIRSIAAIREVVNKRVAELQGTDNNKLKDFRDRIVETYKAHPDGNRVRPTEVPLVIIANKHDTLRALQSAEKKSLMQAIRFIAHYFGAALLTMSTSTAGDGSVMRESYRNLINAIAFSNHGALPTANYKPSCETNVEKGIVISRGQDNFHGILLGAGFSDDVDTGKIKYRLISSESEAGNFITDKGVKKDCWGRLQAHMAGIFGDADPLPSLSLGEETKEMESGDDPHHKENTNPYPEVEVDDMRRVRDAALQRYLLEQERKAEMVSKMNARSDK